MSWANWIGVGVFVLAFQVLVWWLDRRSRRAKNEQAQIWLDRQLQVRGKDRNNGPRH